MRRIVNSTYISLDEVIQDLELAGTLALNTSTVILTYRL